MGQSATEQVVFGCGLHRIEAHFDLDQLTSDGGLLWLAEAEEELGLCAAFSRTIPDWRRSPVQHPLTALVRQRVFQIAAGYADQNDATTLRYDPLFQLCCERAATLASQPTLSRLDNAADAATCAALAGVLRDCYLDQRERHGPPEHLLLDLDSTDDPTHDEQEGSAYHGYHRQHMYHPLLAFDGETNQLISTRLRRGNAHASWEAVDEVERIVTGMRERWPGVTIDLRADGGFAVPELYDACEAWTIDYTIGLPPNSRLETLAAPLVAQAEAQYEQTPRSACLARPATKQVAGPMRAASSSRSR